MNETSKNPPIIYPDTSIQLSDYKSFQEKIEKVLLDNSTQEIKFALLHVSFLNQEGLEKEGFLEKVRAKIAACIRKTDIITRFKEKEFLIGLLGINNKKETHLVANRILQEFSKPIILNHQEVLVSVNIGISIYPEHGKSFSLLQKNADIAMHLSKEKGKNNYHISESSIPEKLQSSTPMERSLKKATSNNEFRLVYQPKIDIKTNQIVGVEALLRWKTSKGDLIYPDEFIPLAEETGEIVPITEWVLRTACRQVKIWHTSGLPRLNVSVNLTARILKEKNFSQTVTSLLNSTGLSYRYLGLEIPERFLLEDITNSIHFIKQLKNIGLLVSVDNVGATQSSIQYLKFFEVDCINIDRIFIQNIIKDKDNAAMVADIINTAHTLNVKVVAPGVETEEQFLFLKKLGCDQCQGYYFSKPIASEDFAREYQKIKAKLF